MQIVPSVLEYTFEGFERQLRRLEPYFPYIQIDIMDGQFVEAKSFPDVERVKDMTTKTLFELHLMVQNPVEEMEKWTDVKNVFRAIIHIESNNVSKAIMVARGKRWQVGLALNPETPLEAIEPYTEKIDAVQFMTVEPGKQGNPFIPAVLEKIKKFTITKKRPACLVDGAVNIDTIKNLAKAGVDVVCPGSALTKAEDVEAALNEMQKMCEHSKSTKGTK